jgi:glycine/D-amino acid oxidase-like deaminating enzyme
MHAHLSQSPLDRLEARLREDIRWLGLPAKEWSVPRIHRGANVLDVAIIGGGMLGLVACAALRNIGIHNIRVFDKATEGREGPWITSARMETLRTRKEAAGTALGIPSLTFRAWFEAQFGTAAFDEMGFVPRAMWMDYLVWYRKVLDLPVENATEVTAIELRDDGLVELIKCRDGATETVLARRVIVATGIDALGQPALPAIAHQIPAETRGSQSLAQLPRPWTVQRQRWRQAQSASTSLSVAPPCPVSTNSPALGAGA